MRILQRRRGARAVQWLARCCCLRTPCKAGHLQAEFEVSEDG